METERKFIPREIPVSIEQYDYLIMEQAYISTEPVIRIRKKLLHAAEAGKTASDSDTAYVLTVKSAGLLTRQEFELDISEDSYRHLLTKAEGNIILKHRYLIPLEDGLTLELDVFQGAFEGLVMGEIEFPDEAHAKKYTPPAYLAEEVTYDSRFHNSTMSTMSSPDISDLISWVHKNH